jgi:AraC family transcriptional activator of tynA and feaB
MPEWNTQDHKVGEQFGFWREVLCEAFIALNSTREFSGGFQANVVANRVADVNVCRLVTDEHNILRTRHEIRKMPGLLFREHAD